MYKRSIFKPKKIVKELNHRQSISDLVNVTRCKDCLCFDSGYCTVNGIFRNKEDYCSRAMRKSV